MESDTASSVQLSSDQSTDHDNPPLVDVFTLTDQDIVALTEYLDEFQEGDIDRRSVIIANAMADLATLRHLEEPFDKLNASIVRSAPFIIYCQSDIFICNYRKSENGFIIIIRDQSDNMSSSSDDGLPGTHFIICVAMKLQLKRKRCPVLCLVHRHI